VILTVMILLLLFDINCFHVVVVVVLVLPLLGFAACLFLLYSLMPLVITKIGAMAVNLNLLSSDFYALLLGLFFFQYKVGYWISCY